MIPATKYVMEIVKKRVAKLFVAHVCRMVSVLLFTGVMGYAAITPKGASPFCLNQGLGVVAGEPAGVTVKYWFKEREAAQALAGYSFDRYAIISADYLYHFLAPGSGLVSYIGIGATFYFSTSGDRATKNVYSFYESREGTSGLGLRVPVGGEWFFSRPFSALIEFAAGIGAIPSAWGIVDGGIGLRAYF